MAIFLYHKLFNSFLLNSTKRLSNDVRDEETNTGTKHDAQARKCVLLYSK